MSAVEAPHIQSSTRYSTYSGAPSIHPSLAPTMDTSRGPSVASSSSQKDKNAVKRTTSTTSTATDARSADIKQWAEGFDRLADRRLEEQRFVPSGEKTDEISTNALGAKLERALEHRLSAQDAELKTVELNEKAPVIEVAAQ